MEKIPNTTNNAEHEELYSLPTDLFEKDYVTVYMKDRVNGTITCMVCGKEGHYTCECPMKDEEYNVVCTLCEKVGHCRLWCCRQYELDQRACSRCGEKGHYTTWDVLNCSSCDVKHPFGRCPTRNITCFLCEGKGHVPAKCPLSSILTAVTQYQRESFRDTLRRAMKTPGTSWATLRPEASSATLVPVKPTAESDQCGDICEPRSKGDNGTVPKVLNFNHGGEGNCAPTSPIKSQVPSSSKDNTPVMTKTPPKKKLGVTCYRCQDKGHYAKSCPQKLSLACSGAELEHQSKGDNEMVPMVFGFNHGVEGNYPRESPISSLVPSSNENNPSSMANITCYRCQDKGHYSNRCPQNPSVTLSSAELGPCDDSYVDQYKADNETVPKVLGFNHGEEGNCSQKGPQVPSSNKIKHAAVTNKGTKRASEVTCFNCLDKGHYAKRCPKKKQAANSVRCPKKRPKI